MNNSYLPKTIAVILKSGNEVILYVVLDTDLDVNAQSSLWVRLSNQLRLSRLPVSELHPSVLPLNILLDTFELLQNAQPKLRVERKKLKKGTKTRMTDRVQMWIDPCQQL